MAVDVKARSVDERGPARKGSKTNPDPLLRVGFDYENFGGVDGTGEPKLGIPGNPGPDLSVVLRLIYQTFSMLLD